MFGISLTSEDSSPLHGYNGIVYIVLVLINNVPISVLISALLLLGSSLNLLETFLANYRW